MKACIPPHGTFRGSNMLTPRILVHYALREGLYAELSTGRGMDSGTRYGVTVRNAAGNDPLRRSKLCFSRSEALAYIESLS